MRRSSGSTAKAAKVGLLTSWRRNTASNCRRRCTHKSGKRIYTIADELSRELTPEEVLEHFLSDFANVSEPLALLDYELDHHVGKRGDVLCRAKIALNGKKLKIEGQGNGPINAFVHALDTAGLKDFTVTDYRSHAVRGGSDADGAAYVQVQHVEKSSAIVWGCGVDSSIEMAGLKALVSAYNLLR